MDKNFERTALFMHFKVATLIWFFQNSNKSFALTLVVFYFCIQIAITPKLYFQAFGYLLIFTGLILIITPVLASLKKLVPQGIFLSSVLFGIFFILNKQAYLYRQVLVKAS